MCSPFMIMHFSGESFVAFVRFLKGLMSQKNLRTTILEQKFQWEQRWLCWPRVYVNNIALMVSWAYVPCQSCMKDLMFDNSFRFIVSDFWETKSNLLFVFLLNKILEPFSVICALRSLAFLCIAWKAIVFSLYCLKNL